MTEIRYCAVEPEKKVAAGHAADADSRPYQSLRSIGRSQGCRRQQIDQEAESLLMLEWQAVYNLQQFIDRR